MIVAALVVVGVVVLLARHRAVSRRRLAGLDGTRPAFAVEPPLRRHHDRSREVL